MKWDSEHFDQWSDEYDDSIEPFVNKFPFIGYYETLAMVQKLSQPVDGLKVLDVGIGTGLLSAELAKAGGAVYGVDFSEKMLLKASGRIPGAKLARVDIARDHLGEFNGEKFDRIVSSYVFHHFDLKQKVAFFTRAIADNLSEGGRIIIGDIGFETLAAHEAAKEKWEEQWDFDEYYTQADEVVAALRDVGLEFSYSQISDCSGVLVYKG
jgi:putative AdoMet-dependent methyltransferase